MFKSMVAIGATALLLGSGLAYAANTCNGATALSATAIQTALVGNYACIKNGSVLENNELHTGAATGTITEYGTGPTGAQPTAVIGNYTITTTNGNGNPDTISYTYNSGGTYVYSISGTASPYSFCESSPGSAVYSVTVQSSHC